MSGAGAETEPAPRLLQYSFSNFNEKVRWALDFKRIPHRRHSLMPGGLRALILSSGGGTIPVLELNGERIVDSTRIIEALEERWPDPALYPQDEGERRQALELEDYFDEHAGHDMRRVGFDELGDHPALIGSLMGTDQNRLARGFVHAGVPVGMAYARRRYGFTEDEVAASREQLVVALDRISSEAGTDGHLVGDAFSVADLTAAALLYPLVMPDEFQYPLPEHPSTYLDAFTGHPAVAWIRETWRRHRGSSAEIR